MVALEPLTRRNWRAALAVRATAEQLPWVASFQPVAAIILAKSFVRPDGQVWHPFAIVEDERIVGVLAVGVDPYDVQTAWLHHVLIDEGEQGRGLGRQAIVAALDWLRDEFPNLRQIGLCVLPDNERAGHLYATLGFTRWADTTDGQSILLRG